MTDRTVEALIFDVDGTLAETEELHRLSFNHAFADAGLPYAWDRERYRSLLSTTGGRQRLHRFFAEEGIAESLSAEMTAQLHQAKNRLYARAIAERAIDLRPGVTDLVRRARSDGLRLAIATTTSRTNLEALLAAFADELPATAFSAIVVGEDVDRLKPHPECYRVALARLGLPPDACLAFEDSANGLAAATAAEIRTVVTPGVYTSHEAFPQAWKLLPDLSGFDWTLPADSEMPLAGSI